MATINDEPGGINGWSLDTLFWTHMTSHRECFVNFDDSRKTKIIFIDNTTIPSEGLGDVLIKGNQGNQVVITSVFYTSNMKSNLLSIVNCLIMGLAPPCQQ